ncbi:hypothetical protein ACFLZU_04135 [Thermodesulfobacteriota bacterium]
MARKPPKVRTELIINGDEFELIPRKPNVVLWNSVCSVDFEINFIPLRLRGKREQWIELDKSMDDKGIYDFERVEKLLYDHENLEELRSFYDSDKVLFSFEVHAKFLMPALSELQHKNIKPEREEYNIARWVYVFLQYWIEEPKDQWPKGLKAYDCTKKKNLICDLETFTGAVLSEYYGENDFDLGDWYKNHITKGNKLRTIKKALSAIGHQPIFLPLSEVFRPPDG